MADINWGLLQTPQALDPITAAHYGAVDAAQRTQDQLSQQKIALAAQQASALASARQQAAQNWAAGNTRMAQANLIGAGDNDTLGSVNTADKQAFDQGEHGAQAVANFAKFVQTLPVGARADVIRHNAPLLQTAGAHPQDIEAVANDPSDSNLGAVSNMFYAAKDQDAAKVSTLTAQTNQQNADTQRMTEQRLEQTPVGIATTDNVYLPGGMSPPGTTFAPSGSAPDGTRAARNNNPGNLRWDGHSQWQGMTGVDPGGFVIFDSPDHGQRALNINIANQQKLHGINTVADFIQKYAPPTDHNDTGAYAQTVARALGVGVNDKIDFTNPQVQRVLSGAITGVESGGTPSKFSSSPPAPGVRGPTLIAAGVPKADPNAVDPNDPAIELAARQYAITGDLPPLGMGNGPMRKAILDRAAQIVKDNHWSPAQIAANKADYKGSTSALANDHKQYDIIQSAENTALNNGQRFIDLSANAPGNTASSWYNEARNYVGGKFGDTRVTDMNAAYQTFINEYTRVVTSTPNGSGQLTDSARHEAMNTLQNSASLDQKKSAFQVLKADMDARRQAQQAQIDARTSHITHLGDPSAVPASAGPVRITNAAQYHALKSGTHYIDPQGHQRVKP